MGRHILSESDRAAIRAAVETAERGTSGEIVTVVTRRSASYLSAMIVIALACAFAGMIAAHMLRPTFGFWTLLAIQAGLLLAVLLLLDLTGAVARLAPAGIRHKAVRRLAEAQFVAHGLHNTPDRAGILILVSLHERCVELIADTGIDARAAQGQWTAIADTLTTSIRRDGVGPALAQAVTSCSSLLAEHFPAKDGPRVNRFGDDVVEL